MAPVAPEGVLIVNWAAAEAARARSAKKDFIVGRGGEEKT